jgi:hypothetical protein
LSLAFASCGTAVITCMLGPELQLIETTTIPSIKFRYDISPMSVVVTEKTMPLYHFITNACAIIGGVFTVIGMLDSAVYHGSKAIKKKTQLGKQG